MGNELEKVRPGLYERKNTPKHVDVSPDFVKKITEKSESSAFKRAMEQIAARDRDRRTSA